MPGHEAILKELRARANPANVAGQERFGIRGANRLGISVTELRKIARAHRHDHTLARALWESNVHEARMLAVLIDDPAQVTKTQMERWLRDFDSWDIVDGACADLFDKTPWAYEKAIEWAARKPEYQKRAAFALMAALAVHDKTAPDDAFLTFLPVIARAADDERNFVKKAVNWALRQIGKRNARLHQAAIATAESIRAQGSRSARWIAADALRELRSPQTRARVGNGK